MLKEKLLDSSYHCIHWVVGMYVYDYASSLSALLIKGIAEMLYTTVTNANCD